MPPSHPFVIIRLILIGIIVAPSVRQYYSYVTDTQCKRVGTQCWVYGAIMFTEAILCVKNGKELFERTQAVNIILWLLLQLCVSILCVYGCVLWNKYFYNETDMSRENSPVKSPGEFTKDQILFKKEQIGDVLSNSRTPEDMKKCDIVDNSKED